MPEIDKQPPAYIEGPAGGPAFPTGGMSADDKEYWDEASDTTNFEGGVMAVDAAICFAFSPEGTPFGVGAGIVSGVLWMLSQVFSDLAEEPPQPHQRIVSIEPRVSRLPQTTDPVLARVGIAWQQGVFTLVTARAYLDALERLAGAQQAQDLSWAITHWGVAEQCRRTIIVNVATTAAALYGVAQSLKTSSYDLSLTADSADVRQWIESPGVEETMNHQLAEAGLMSPEIQEVIQWWKTNPAYTGPTTMLSAQLEKSSQTLYSSAERLNSHGQAVGLRGDKQ